MSAPPGGFPPGFKWDEVKHQANVLKHGIDFLDAVRILNNPTLDRVDARQGYGEVRTNSVGDIGRLIIATVTHTDRGAVTPIISARAASSTEREAYRAFQTERWRTP